MKVCVLQPSYERSEKLRDYAQHDPPRDLSALVPEWQFTHAFLHKATTYDQIKNLKKNNFDIFVNLCEGHLEWDVPSIDVIHALESLDLPYTGPTAALYEPRKDTAKLVARYAGVRTPRHVAARNVADIERAGRNLRFPLFVKPNEGGDSFGIDEHSLCADIHALSVKAQALLDEYDAILIEEFVGGREFSVLVAANPENPRLPVAWRPVEFRFPAGERFKSYTLKNTQFHPELNVMVEDGPLKDKLVHAAQQIFFNHAGAGYSRMDFRLDDEGEPHVLDVNFTCSVFYPDGFFGTADYILRNDPQGAAGFLRHIVADGIARWEARRSIYTVRNEGISGIGIAAARAIGKGEIVFKGEERAQRLATRRWVQENWRGSEIYNFTQYAYPIDSEVFILWSENPRDWAPQNHSCDPNCGYDGLNVIALRDIPAGEEMTFDYADCYSETMEPFACTCGASNCRGIVRGSPNNSIVRREKLRRMACTPVKQEQPAS